MVSITSRIVAALVVLGLVAGCGGGTSPSAQAEAVTTKTLSMTAQTVNAAGAESNRFEEGEAVELRALMRETTRTVGQGRGLSE